MQIIIFTLGLLFSLAAALPTGQVNSNGSVAVPAIVDGQPPPPTKINFREVAIVSDADYPPVKLCSGVLIKPDWVLTSAYCVQGKTVLRVLVGSPIINAASLGQTGKLVNKVIIHPYYNSLYLIHDIALLYVRDVANGDKTTLAALPNLPTTATEYVWQNAIVAGFGLDGNSAGTSVYGYRYKDVQIIDNNHCMADGHYMNYYKLCTYGRAVCVGDEGGPLTVGNTVVGIASVSLKAQDCEQQRSITYTRVNYYRQWIDQQIYLTCRC